MLCRAYETLARRGEFVALELKDIDLRPAGTGQPLIPRGKTEAEGEGRRAYFSRETVRWLKVWLEHAKIIEGNFDPLNDQEILHGVRIPTAVNACETYCLVKRAP